jgi:hypothetical protein
MEGYYEDTFGKEFMDNDNMDMSYGSRNELGERRTDKHKHRLTTSIKKYGANGKPKGYETIDCYSTPYHSSKIRDAISGEYTKYTIGKKEEELFFKVVIAMGMSKDGPIHLYYFSPGQYEQHQRCTVSDAVKVAWQRKYNMVCDELGL